MTLLVGLFIVFSLHFLQCELDVSLIVVTLKHAQEVVMHVQECEPIQMECLKDCVYSIMFHAKEQFVESLQLQSWTL